VRDTRRHTRQREVLCDVILVLSGGAGASDSIMSVGPGDIDRGLRDSGCARGSRTRVTECCAGAKREIM